MREHPDRQPWIHIRAETLNIKITRKGTLTELGKNRIVRDITDKIYGRSRTAEILINRISQYWTGTDQTAHIRPFFRFDYKVKVSTMKGEDQFTLVLDNRRENLTIFGFMTEDDLKIQELKGKYTPRQWRSWVRTEVTNWWEDTLTSYRLDNEAIQQQDQTDSIQGTRTIYATY